MRNLNKNLPFYSTIIPLIFLTFCLIGPDALAQEMIYGQITDCASGKPLVGATVKYDGKIESIQSTTTDEAGNYQLEFFEDKAYLIVSHPAYDPDTVKLENAGLLDTCLYQAGLTPVTCDLFADFNAVTDLESYSVGSRFNSDSLTFEVRPFPGKDTAASKVRLDSGNIADGDGYELVFNNAYLVPNLPEGANYIRFQTDRRASIDSVYLRINDSEPIYFLYTKDLNDYPTVAGVDITYKLGKHYQGYDEKERFNYQSTWEFSGAIESFEFGGGGSMLFVDDFCIGVSPSDPRPPFKVKDCEEPVSFDDLEKATFYPSDSSFTSDGVRFAVRQLPNLEVSKSRVFLDNTSQKAGGENYELVFDDAYIEPSLSPNTTDISFRTYRGGSESSQVYLYINGEEEYFTNSEQIKGQTLGGVTITLEDDLNYQENYQSVWAFTGAIQTFRIGGRGTNMVIDNFCIKPPPKVIPVPTDCASEVDFEFVPCSSTGHQFMDKSTDAGEENGYIYALFVDQERIYQTEEGSSLEAFRWEDPKKFGESKARLDITAPNGCKTSSPQKIIWVDPILSTPTFKVDDLSTCEKGKGPPSLTFQPKANFFSDLDYAQYTYTLEWGNLEVPSEKVTSKGEQSLDDGSPIIYQFPALPPGRYQVKLSLLILDQDNSCAVSNTEVFEIFPPLVADYRVQADTCESSFGVTLAPSGGRPPYQYRLGYESYVDNPTFEELSPGTYTFEVTDAGKCTQSNTLTLEKLFPPLVLNEPVIATQACGAAKATLKASGGSAPYQYRVDDGEFSKSPEFEELSPGLHTFEVKDANQCLQSTSIEVPETSSTLAVKTADIQNDACETFSVTLEASGGSTPYRYRVVSEKSRFSETPEFKGLSLGAYTFEVVDYNDCTERITIDLVNTFPALVLEPVSVDHDACGTASVTLKASGGRPAYQYRLNEGPWRENAAFQELEPGNYTFEVKDGNECIQSTMVSIEAIKMVTVDIQKCESPAACDQRSFPPPPAELIFRAEKGTFGLPSYYHYWVKKISGNNHQIVAFGAGIWGEATTCAVPGVLGNDQIEVVIIKDLSSPNPMDLSACPITIREVVNCSR